MMSSYVSLYYVILQRRAKQFLLLNVFKGCVSSFPPWTLRHNFSRSGVIVCTSNMLIPVSVKKHSSG